MEFLHRIMDIFTEYFSECTEQRIKEHYVTVYEVINLYNVYTVLILYCVYTVVIGRDVG